MTVVTKLSGLMTLTAVCITLMAGSALAEPPRTVPVQDVSSEEEIRAALFGGVPMDRWKEGLLLREFGLSPG